MATSKHIEKICIFAVILALLVTVVFMNGEALGIQVKAKTIGYENKLFDTSKVHTIDIRMEDWDAFLKTATSEVYSMCDVVIDGEPVTKVGIRGKGNTSLSSVSASGSQRYSFKIEFDQYDDTKTYHGLDKLCLNNLIQDTTMMKDYLAYQLMAEFGAPAPMCSYVYVTVNGEPWGLYLAVEAIEDSFLQRNFGLNHGDLYKPDTIDMGDNAGADIGTSGDANLRYIDDNPSSYVSIFSSAKTEVTEEDQHRVVASLKTLNQSEDVESVLYIDKVLRYFVVHNYVVNGDSYTGNIIHNYYLYEKDGKFAMIPWDYNLGYGTFMSGDTNSVINDDIDSPLSVNGNDRPMIDWIYDSEAYTQMYHEYFQEFLDTVDVQAIIANAVKLITPYVEQDPTKFCSFAEFETGSQIMSSFCLYRSQSVQNQLDGKGGNVNASSLNLSAMGSMGGMGGGSSGGGEENQDPGCGGEENQDPGCGGEENQDPGCEGCEEGETNPDVQQPAEGTPNDECNCEGGETQPASVQEGGAVTLSAGVATADETAPSEGAGSEGSEGSEGGDPGATEPSAPADGSEGSENGEPGATDPNAPTDGVMPDDGSSGGGEGDTNQNPDQGGNNDEGSSGGGEDNPQAPGQGNTPGGNTPGTDETLENNKQLMLITVLSLLAGLAFAFAFKR